MGSGVRKLFKYCKAFCGNNPELVGGDVFRFILPLIPKTVEQVTEQAKRKDKILDFCKIPKTAAEIMEFLGLSQREHFGAEILTPLIKQGLLHLTVPDKPKSPNQRYYSDRNKS